MKYTSGTVRQNPLMARNILVSTTWLEKYLKSLICSRSNVSKEYYEKIKRMSVRRKYFQCSDSFCLIQRYKLMLPWKLWLILGFELTKPHPSDRAVVTINSMLA